METFTFSVFHYALLSITLLSFHGWGYLVTAWLRQNPAVPIAIAVCFRLSAGMGIAILLLIVVASFDWLRPGVILGLLATGMVVNVFAWRNSPPMNKAVFPGSPPASVRVWTALIIAVTLPLLLKPLLAPHDWDTLAYHLPHARAWAEHGGLAVNEWIRFPLIPFNMQLLYSSAMVFDNDILPQLFNAATAALAMVILLAGAQRWLDFRTGALAFTMLAFATRDGWSSANVDFAVMLYWLCAYVALAISHESGDKRLLYLSVLFVGLAAGVKYQALLYLPVYVVLVLVIERRPSVLFRALILFLLLSFYWYLRNFLVSGNPVHPVASQWFGYWNWSASDLEGQINDLHRIRGWPHWYLVCAVFSVVFWRDMSRIVRVTFIVTAVSVLIWAVMAGHPRYLSAMYPMMSLLSAYFFIQIFQRFKLSALQHLQWSKPITSQRTAMAFSVLLIAAGWVDFSRIYRQITPDADGRVSSLRQQFSGYDLLLSVPNEDLGTLYQLGFEGEFYYLGEDVIGDWFGPGRYGDVAKLSNDAEMLSRHLETMGADSLLINHQRQGLDGLEWDSEMGVYFDLLAQSGSASLYRLKTTIKQ